jgi:hypothetical protein
MSEADILHWIRDTWLGATVRESRWIFASGEILHFVGLSLLVGGILIVDLRLLGFIRRVPIRAALAFLPFVIAGFLINLLTGIVFFSADPMMYWPSPAFKLKMFLILLAGLNALVFIVMAQRKTLSLRDDESTGTLAKVTAGLSLGLWLCVLLLGRLLPAFEGSTSFF